MLFCTDRNEAAVVGGLYDALPKQAVWLWRPRLPLYTVIALAYSYAIC